MANAWFRMYAEFRSDPKVRTMSDTMQIRLVRLFCLRCDSATEKLSRDELMFALGCNDDETFHETESLFLAKGFIDKNWSLLNWNKRQFISDSSTERVRKFRANHAQKQDETFQETHETQNVTDQNRTEQSRADQNRGEGTREARPTTPPPIPFVTPRTPQAGADGEFMLAVTLGQEIKLAMRNSDIALVAQVIANESDEHGGPLEAKDFIRSKALEARARGEPVTMFWLQDRKFAVEERDIYAAYLAKGD